MRLFASTSLLSGRSLRGWLLGAASVGLLAGGGCGANHNVEERQREAQRRQEESDRLGATVSEPCVGDPSQRCCVNTCKPDPGSRPVDCAEAEGDLEFMQPALLTFEGSGSNRANLYAYADRSGVYSDASPRRQVAGSFFRRDVQATTERCGAPAKALHFWGGLFRGWGGGIGAEVNTAPTGGVGGTCTEAFPTNFCENPSSYSKLARDTQKAPSSAFSVDASAWEGISFWARRGPDGQAQLRVGFGDKYTDDRLNRYPNSMFCQRSRSCDCPNGKPCTPAPKLDRRSYCWDPAVDPEPVQASAVTDGRPDFTEYYLACGQSRCEEEGEEADPSYQGRACTPFVTAGGESRSYCYNKGQEPDPPEGFDQCGDHWTTAVHVTQDWQLFLVPFDSLRQQGYGKDAPSLTLTELTLLRFTWESGWVDFWIDDVRFYRHKR